MLGSAQSRLAHENQVESEQVGQYFVDLLNLKEGLIECLETPPAYEEFLEQLQREYQAEGMQCTELQNFPKHYRVVEQPLDSKRKKQTLICKFKNCRARFTDVSILIDHLLMHDGKRPYRCDVCQSSFTQLGNLRRHKRIHNKIVTALRFQDFN